MSNIFSKELTQPNNQTSIQGQPATSGVDNSTANTINALTGLAKFGTEAYQAQQRESTINSVAAQVNKNMTAVRQGKMKIGDADIKNSALLSEAITANPQLTTELRQTTIAITGTDVTAEAFAAARLEEDQAAGREATAVNSFVQTAAAAGYAPRKADGSLDQQAMIDYGIAENGRKTKLANIKAQLGSMTAEERKDQSITKLEPVYKEFSGAKLESLLSVLDANQPDIGTGASALEQEDALLARITQGKVLAERELRDEVIAAGGTSSIADAYVERFREEFAPYEKLYTEDRSVAGKLNAQVQVLKAAGFSNTYEATPDLVDLISAGFKVDTDSVKKISKAQGQAFDTFGKASTDGTRVTRPTINSYLKASSDALHSGKSFNTIPEGDKPAVYKGAVQMLSDGLKSFDSSTPNERVGITNALNTHVQAGSLDSNSNENTVKFAQYYNGEAIRNTVQRLYQDSATKSKVKLTADTRLSYIEAMVKKARSNGVEYNSETQSTGNPVLDTLLGNIDTFYEYSGRKDKNGIDKYKESLFGEEKESSVFDIFN